jgi:hypothetical protein
MEAPPDESNKKTIPDLVSEIWCYIPNMMSTYDIKPKPSTMATTTKLTYSGTSPTPTPADYSGREEAGSACS